MGRITDALKKVTDERIERIKRKPEYQYVIKKVEGSTLDEHIVAFHDPTSPVGEEYKMLRTNIQSLNAEKNYRTFVITSAVDGEGKSMTSVNLAITMAHDLNGKSVLLIDADMRRSRVAKYLGIKGQHAGLAEVLKGEANEGDVLIDAGIENLTVMLAGKHPKNPAELLNSKKMEAVLRKFREKFDYIFIDTPPVMLLTDACILGYMVDGVMMVVQAGKTQRDSVKQAETKLVQARAKVLGYVMTNLEYHLPTYLYRYAHGYNNYKYYREREKVGKK